MIRYNLYGIALFAMLRIYAGKEIELKIGLTELQQQNVESWLKHNAQFVDCSVQTEYYLTKPDEEWDYGSGFRDTLRTIRVRLENKGDSVCYKYRHIDPTTKKTTHRDEEETKVDDGNTMIKILGNLGYTEKTLVSKTRSTYLVDNIFEVVFDDVDKVGKFVEIELKEKVDNVKEGLIKIEALMKRIGISEFKQYDRGYIHMIWNPEYNFGINKKI